MVEDIDSSSSSSSSSSNHNTTSKPISPPSSPAVASSTNQVASPFQRLLRRGLSRRNKVDDVQNYNNTSSSYISQPQFNTMNNKMNDHVDHRSTIHIGGGEDPSSQNSSSRLPNTPAKVSSFVPMSKSDRRRLKMLHFKYECLTMMDSTFTTVFMSLVTIYALFSDDVRVLAFGKESDTTFVVLSSIAFFLFLIEIILQCWCRDKYLQLPDVNTIFSCLRSLFQCCYRRDPYGARRDTHNLTLSSDPFSEQALQDHMRQNWIAFKKVITIGSFYFWLDLMATMSMIFELPYLVTFVSAEDYASAGSDARAGKASRTGAKAARMIRVVRMIRLVRLVRLYKYFSEQKQLTKRLENSSVTPMMNYSTKTMLEPSTSTERKRSTLTTKNSSSTMIHGMKVSPESENNNVEEPRTTALHTRKTIDSRCTLQREINMLSQESRVGAEMSDRTSKKVILGILIMLIVIPLLTVDDLEFVNEFGMQMVLDQRSALQLNNFNTSHDSWNGWKLAENYFLDTTNCLQLAYNGFNDGGTTYATVPSDRPDPDMLRSTDKASITIRDELEAYSMTGVFDISDRADEEALLGIMLTLFVILLLAIGTMTFSRDVDALVIIPIEKMVKLVRDISINPLGTNHSISEDEFGDDGMETTLLLRTISKIAGLMRVGFGEAGAEIIGSNLNTSHDEFGPSSLNLLGNGKKILSIFGFCDVRNFTDTTECLQEEVMLFVNRIAHILHSIVVQCDGAANKNIGDAFLLTWKLNPAMIETGRHNHGYAADKALYSFLKTMVTMNRHEDFICNFSPSSLGALYERMPGYKCRIGCGLHFGWAVEGAIGSDKKIDASYISPHVNMAEFLESSTKEYEVPILLSEPFFNLLSSQAKMHCRQVDNIKKSEHDDVMGMYTYEANLDHFAFRKIQTRDVNMGKRSRKSMFGKVGRRSVISLIEVPDDIDTTANMPQESESPQKKKDFRTSLGILGEAPEIDLPPFSIDVWEMDEDMVHLRAHFKTSTRQAWDDAMKAFIAGDWDLSTTYLNKVLEETNGKDGPAKNLLQKMKVFDNKVPENWKGYRIV